jgi:hypothetical protein
MTKKDIFFSKISEIGVGKQPVSRHTPTKMSRGAKVDEIRDIKDIAKAVREYVKKKYPNCKFSVSIDRFAGGQSMTVSLKEADFNPLTDESLWSVSADGNKYFSVNQYHFEKSEKLTPEAISVLKDVRDFYNQYNYNHSDPQTDYFNTRFYETLTIGQWDKGFVQVAKKSKTPRTPRPAPKKGGSQPKYSVGAKVSYRTSKGFEVGKVLGSKLIASKDSYLYEVENPRGGTYRIWESNIISGEKMPELPTPEKPKSLFNVGQTVRIKGRPEKYIITELIPIGDDGVQLYEAKYTETGDLFPLVENTLELALEDETPEPKYRFKVGDVFRRNMGDEAPPNTKITYTILSINEEKSQYRIDSLDKGISRLSTKSNEKITDEISSGWWIAYEPLQEENNSLKDAISQLKDENDLMWDMYVSSEDTNLRKELRETTVGNCEVINDFSADLYFDPQKFMDKYFDRATEKFAYDNSELSKEEFKKIVESEEFINWFGDFRKPVQEAICSKVLKLGLDDDKSAVKEPLIVYHGTWNKAHFSRFKFTKFPVIYFATNKSYAEWFAKIGTGIIYQCFLDIKYLCDFRGLGLSTVTWEELSNFLKEQYGFSLPERETKGAKLPAWAWIRNDAPNFALINTIKEQGFTGMAHIEDNPQDILPNGEKNSTTAYMIFNPEQAKLVRYVSTGNAFTDIFFMKKGGKVQSALLQKIKNLKL